jgi:hypothetical protein
LGTDFTASMFPNPSKGVLNIDSETKIFNVKVFNSEGELVYDRNADSYQMKLDLSHMSNGLYFITLNNFQSTARLIIND